MQRGLMGGLVVVAVALAGCSLLGVERGNREEARWTVDPAVRIASDATELPLLVQEVDCASGRSAEGRISSDVDVERDRIVITVFVERLPGGQECPSNPATPYTLTLPQPLDGRELVNGATDDQALRAVDGLGEGADGPGGASVPDPGAFEVVGEIPGPLLALAEALVARATDPEELADTGDLSPHRDGVRFYAADRLVRVASPDELADPQTWVLRIEELSGFAGPFDVLESLRDRQLAVAVGPEPHCAGPPKDAPSGFEDATRLAITTTDGDSCIDWAVVNLYVDDDARLVAVQLDLFGP